MTPLVFMCLLLSTGHSRRFLWAGITQPYQKTWIPNVNSSRVKGSGNGRSVKNMTGHEGIQAAPSLPSNMSGGLVVCQSWLVVANPDTGPTSGPPDKKSRPLQPPGQTFLHLRI